MANRLARQTSPYLLQHQHNPVDWYPWGREAFEAARSLNRPIFLSVGYSTCYWCHVMERQSFENPAIADLMNQKFINIKVDREERPDVDQLYMTAVQVLTRQGGWPMSVFLLPDLRPFYGGTYFPPTDGYGRPGFPTLLNAIDDAFRNRRAQVEQSAGQLVEVLRELAEPSSQKSPPVVDGGLIGELIDRSIADFDPRAGGFGGAPKFPRQTLLELLLVYQSSPSLPDAARDLDRRNRVREALDITLDRMMRGGIRDQLGGGFHRYSTDSQWLVPHFEIMLYDNAMLLWCYAEAHRQLPDPRWEQAARGIADFVLREMTSPAGAFYTAFDAEVDAREGGPYLWTPAQVREVLGDADAEVFNRVYGLDRGFNFADPHHGAGVADQNILYLPEPLEHFAAELHLPLAALTERLEAMKLKLRDARSRRKQPLLDTKILTSWNALMIRALAHAGGVLQQRRYIDAAARAANYLLAEHRSENGGLIRASGGFGTSQSETRISGFLDDYAFFAQSLLELADQTADPAWRTHAEQVLAAVIERFGDGVADRGFYFTDARADDLIVRQKTATDSPLPSGNGVAAMVLHRLGHSDAARGVVQAFAGQLPAQAEAMSSMVQAALLLLDTNRPSSTAASASDTPEDTAVQISLHETSPRRWQVILDIQDGYHLNSQEVSSPGLVPTGLSLPTDAKVTYPAGELVQFAFADQPLSVYAGRVVLELTLGSETGPIFLTYQACTEQACLAPVRRKIHIAAPAC